MKQSIFVMMTLLLFASWSQAKTFYSKDRKIKVEVSLHWNIVCQKNDIQDGFSIYDGKKGCVLTQSSLRCKSGALANGGCPQGQWKTEFKERLLEISKTANEGCLAAAKKLMEEKQKDGFACNQAEMN